MCIISAPSLSTSPRRLEGRSRVFQRERSRTRITTSYSLPTTRNLSPTEMDIRTMEARRIPMTMMRRSL